MLATIHTTYLHYFLNEKLKMNCFSHKKKQFSYDAPVANAFADLKRGTMGDELILIFT
jgi:hypothetical protein